MNLVLINVRFYSKKIANVMKYLNVAEKNDAAKTISGFLSNGTSRRSEGFSVYNKIYSFDTDFRGNRTTMVMTSVSGHLLQQEFVSSYMNWNSCDPISLFNAPVVKLCPDNSANIKRTLEREIKSCKGLIVWTDCDREGENIGFEIIDVCRAVKPNIEVYRAKFSEITAASVKRALHNIGQPDERQSQAVDARSELDLRIGAAFTRFQTIRYQTVFPSHVEGLVSYGSCQIPTLGFVARRFNEVERFIPQPFWKLKVSHTINELTVDFLWARNRLFDHMCCEALLMVCQADPTAHILSVTEKPKSKWRPQALDTIELEKLGSRKLKISAKETMTIAEKLYTQGLISYPRTETNIFSNDINLSSLVEMQRDHPAWGGFANRVMEWGPNPRNGKKSDQAHPPIHPTKMAPNLGGNEQRVYELVVRHFLACVSKDATGSETTVNATIANEEFTATGLCIYERNYLDVYIYDKWNAKEIHNYREGDTFQPTELEMVEGTTSAPALLTEADLIALMDKHGIGTDATHAEHINTIKQRGYIGEINNGHLVPGTLGMGLVEGYDAVNLPLAYPELRAELERDLKAICDGQRDPKIVLSEQIEKYKVAYQQITEKIIDMDRALGNRFNEAPRDPPPGSTHVIAETFQCPKCDNFKMALRTKKDNNGFFIGCLGHPGCNHVIWLPSIIKEIKVDTNSCTRCGSKKFIIKFKQMNVLAMLTSSNTIDNLYNTCMVCDGALRSVLDIADNMVKKTNRPATANARQQNQLGHIADTGRSTTTTIRSNNINNDRNNFNAPRVPAPAQSRAPPVPSRAPSNDSANRNRNNTINNPGSSWGSAGGGSSSGPSGPSTSNSWGNAGSTTRGNDNSVDNNQNVRCAGCNEPATKLTVKKEGPNKGRMFYKCPKPNACNFFQWADDNPGSGGPPGGGGGGGGGGSGGSGGGGTWGHSNNNNRTNDNGSARPVSKRKCSNCKQEGHIRTKCPRLLNT